MQAVELARARFPDDRKEVAADAAGHGLDHAEHRVGGDGGVDRVTAAAEHVDPGLHGQWLARGHHSVRRMYGRSSDGSCAADVARRTQRRICGHRPSQKVPPEPLPHSAQGAKSERSCPGVTWLPYASDTWDPPWEARS